MLRDLPTQADKAPQSGVNTLYTCNGGNFSRPKELRAKCLQTQQHLSSHLGRCNLALQQPQWSTTSHGHCRYTCSTAYMTAEPCQTMATD